MTYDEAVKILTERVERELVDIASTKDIHALKVYLDEQLKQLEARLKN